MIKLYAFHGGSETWDKSIFTLHRDLGKLITIPIQYFLVEHPSGRLMFDTGLHPDHINNVDRVRGVRPWQTDVTEADLAPNRLAEIGLRPEDIRLVANSHLHYDHAGGNLYFKDATFLVQFDELRCAMWPEIWLRRNYDRRDFDLPVNFKELDGDYDVFGDGKVTLLKMPGHTPGSQALMLDLSRDGTVILAQDAVYLRENLEELILPSNLWEPHAVIRSYRRLYELQKAHRALLVPGHDWEAWQKLVHAPMFYE